MILKEERERQKLSRAGLARLAEMHASTVGMIEAGRLQPYDTQLEKLARALGWPGEPGALITARGVNRPGASRIPTHD